MYKIFLTTTFVLAASAQAAHTRTITLTTSQPACSIELQEDFNATVDGPEGMKSVSIPLSPVPHLRDNGHDYEYTYVYGIWTNKPETAGGLNFMISYVPDEGSIQIQIRHQYPVFPPSFKEEKKLLIDGRNGRQLVSINKYPLINGRLVAPLFQQFDITALVNFEKVFGVAFIKTMSIRCN